MNRFTYILLISLLFSFFVKAEHAPSLQDSLLNVWNNKQLQDTTRIKAIKQLAWQVYAFTNTDTAEMYAQMGFKLAEQKGNKKYMSMLLNTLGTISALKGNYTVAIQRLNKALNIQQQQQDFYGVAKTYNNIGYIFRNQGKYAEALDYQLKSIQIQEKYKYGDFKLATLINIGITYQEFNDYQSALKYYLKGLKFAEITNDTLQIADIQNNIGLIYVNQKEYRNALSQFTSNIEIFKKSNNYQRMASTYLNIGLCHIYLERAEEALINYQLAEQYYNKVGDQNGIIKVLNNIGGLYKKQLKYNDALNYYLKSLELCKLIDSKKEMASALGNVGYIYRLQNKNSKAKTYLEDALRYAQEAGAIEEISYAASYLWDFYKSTHDYENALIMHELYMQMKDSISSDEKQKELIKATTKFIYEKKAAADSVLNAKQLEIKNVELNKQRIQIKAKRNEQIALFVGLLLVLIFSGLMYNRYRVTQHQKIIIENAHKTLEIKSKEILDSINYSKRIQKAILPPERLVKEYLSNSFVLYLPKDIVAGDFYWIEKVDQKIYIAVCDCTGHGVPGALVSVVCNNALNRAVNEFGERLPGKIFDKTRELIVENFAKSDEEVKDGMDASLAAIDLSNLYSENITNALVDNKVNLTWAGANNPMWILRKKENTHEIIEFKPNKQPLGKGYESSPFTTHQIELQKGDTIYLFTDGFADQFGGENGKKLTKAKLRDFALSIANQDMEQQRVSLLNYHLHYRGMQEQVDDICVIGVRV
jgi:serine phosphatase RsbU (regulator of sigma subunit)/Flp pilus assembly protein TadD